MKILFTQTRKLRFWGILSLHPRSTQLNCHFQTPTQGRKISHYFTVSPATLTTPIRKNSSPTKKLTGSPQVIGIDSPAGKKGEHSALKLCDSPAGKRTGSPAKRPDSPRHSNSPYKRNTNSPAKHKTDSPAKRGKDSPSKKADSVTRNRQPSRCTESPLSKTKRT